MTNANPERNTSEIEEIVVYPEEPFALKRSPREWFPVTCDRTGSHPQSSPGGVQGSRKCCSSRGRLC